MATRHVAESAVALRNLMKRMIDLHVQQNLLGVITSTSPVTVDVTTMDMGLSEDENLILSHHVRKYDQEHGLQEGDTLLLVPTQGGDYVATAVISAASNIGGLRAASDAVDTSTTEIDPTFSLHVVVGGTTYPVVGTIAVPLQGTTTFYDPEGNPVGEVPLL